MTRFIAPIMCTLLTILMIVITVSIILLSQAVHVYQPTPEDASQGMMRMIALVVVDVLVIAAMLGLKDTLSDTFPFSVSLSLPEREPKQPPDLEEVLQDIRRTLRKRITRAAKTGGAELVIDWEEASRLMCEFNECGYQQDTVRLMDGWDRTTTDLHTLDITERAQVDKCLSPALSRGAAIVREVIAGLDMRLVLFDRPLLWCVASEIGLPDMRPTRQLGVRWTSSQSKKRWGIRWTKIQSKQKEEFAEI